MFKVTINLRKENGRMETKTFTFGTYEAATSFIEDAMAHQEENYIYTIEETGSDNN